VTARRGDERPSRRIDGDVHVGTMGADIRLVPGSTTPAGAKAIARQMQRVLDQVRGDAERNGTRPRR
jgi:hypothetical protein